VIYLRKYRPISAYRLKNEEQLTAAMTKRLSRAKQLRNKTICSMTEEEAPTEEDWKRVSFYRNFIN
jgi:hypothetical protein